MKIKEYKIHCPYRKKSYQALVNVTISVDANEPNAPGVDLPPRPTTAAVHFQAECSEDSLIWRQLPSGGTRDCDVRFVQLSNTDATPCHGVAIDATGADVAVDDRQRLVLWSENRGSKLDGGIKSEARYFLNGSIASNQSLRLRVSLNEKAREAAWLAVRVLLSDAREPSSILLPRWPSKLTLAARDTSPQRHNVNDLSEESLRHCYRLENVGCSTAERFRVRIRMQPLLDARPKVRIMMIL